MCVRGIIENFTVYSQVSSDACEVRKTSSNVDEIVHYYTLGLFRKSPGISHSYLQSSEHESETAPLCETPKSTEVKLGAEDGGLKAFDMNSNLCILMSSFPYVLMLIYCIKLRSYVNIKLCYI